MGGACEAEDGERAAGQLPVEARPPQLEPGFRLGCGRRTEVKSGEDPEERVAGHLAPLRARAFISLEGKN